MGSQDTGGMMTAHAKMSCPHFVILIFCMTGSRADLGQDQQNRLSEQYEPPAEGAFVSPSKEYEVLLQELEQYEKPELPHVAPINEVYNQLDGSYYDKYNIEKQDDIEEQDDTENQNAPDITPILAIIVPSVVIGLVALIFNAVLPLFADTISNKDSRSDDSIFSFLPKPQGGIRSTSCELNHLTRDPKFPILSRIISPLLSNSFNPKFSNGNC